MSFICSLFRRARYHMAIAVLVMAASAAAQPPAPPEYSTQEATFLGGAQFFNWFRDRPDHSFAQGGMWGVRFTQNFWTHIGLEESFQYGVNNLYLNTVQPYPVTSVGAGVRNYQASIGPVYHFTPREAKVRPYV